MFSNKKVIHFIKKNMNKLLSATPVIYLLVFSLNLYGQSLESTTTASLSDRPFSLGLNPGISGFQNLKESLVQYHGLSYGFEAAYQKHFGKSILNAAIGYNIASKTKGKSDQSDTKEPHLQFRTSYLFRVKDFDSWKLFAGTEISVSKLTRKNALLLNNSDYEIIEIPLSAVFSARGKIKNQHFRFDLGLGLLGFVAESNSFAYPYPQSLIEDGEVEFGPGPPETFKYGRVEAIGKYLKFKTGVTWQLNDHWHIGYAWNFTSYARVKNYPVAYATHLVQVNWLFGKKSSNQ